MSERETRDAVFPTRRSPSKFFPAKFFPADPPPAGAPAKQLAQAGDYFERLKSGEIPYNVR